MPHASTSTTDGVRGGLVGGVLAGIGILGSVHTHSFRVTESSTARSAGDSTRRGWFTVRRCICTYTHTDLELRTITTSALTLITGVPARITRKVRTTRAES